MTPKVEPPKDEYYHYQLVCQFCGETWWGLHCPHDGYQNPCPNCDRPPIPIKGNCTCEMVAPIDTIKLQQEAAKKDAYAAGYKDGVVRARDERGRFTKLSKGGNRL